MIAYPPCIPHRLSCYRACGKLVLFGEHFELHGAPVLAFPVTHISTRVTISKMRSPRSDPPQLLIELPQGVAQNARQIMALATRQMGIEMDSCRGWIVEVRATIPAGCGLGSSTSFAVAIVGALARASGRELALNDLHQYVKTLSKMVEGPPSSIDDSVITYQRPVWFMRGQPAEPLSIQRSLKFVLASSGAPGASSEAVQRVLAFKQQHPQHYAELHAEAIEVAYRGKKAIAQGDVPQLGMLLDRYHQLLQSLGVSTPPLDRLAEIARAAGAHGAKLTGTGAGGFLVAVVSAQNEARVVQALRRAGAPLIIDAPYQGTSFC
jgi:mevalonate kinase